jgi:hypothetical protein
MIDKNELKGCITAVRDALGIRPNLKGRHPFMLSDDCSLQGVPTDAFKAESKKLEGDMVLLGRHPRLTYEIFVKESILDTEAFWRPSYKLQDLGLKDKQLKSAVYRKLDELKQNPQPYKTRTSITTTSIKSARNYPRTSQRDIMDKTPADTVHNTLLGSQPTFTIFCRSRG